MNNSNRHIKTKKLNPGQVFIDKQRQKWRRQPTQVIRWI